MNKTEAGAGSSAHSPERSLTAIGTVSPSRSTTAFLSAPPFPGAQRASLGGSGSAKVRVGGADIERLVARVRELKVGGTYWGTQPRLPDGPCVIVRIRDVAERGRCLREAAGNGMAVSWVEPDWQRSPASSSATVEITGPCDPWHVLDGAAELVVDADDEVALVSALLGVATRAPVGEPVSDGQVRERFRAVAAAHYATPFTGEPIDVGAAVELCGFWRKLIDSNRGIEAAVGFALWKRPTVAPLLWAGGSTVPFTAKLNSARKGARVAVWKSRTTGPALRSLEESCADVTEVEDGFIRSIGLGADCVPPLSIVVDRLGIYFDPSRPSELEELLEDGDFAPAIVERARALRELVVRLGISKYNVGTVPLQRREDGKRQLLVVGQVDDDRAVTGGLGPATSLELLRQVREANPDAHIIYKPHPDVEASHRAGAIAEDVVLSHASELVRDAPMASLIEIVDEVHVNTSLAGFEALLRHKPVTTYGVPFYAGWGLTRDLGPVPDRRTRRRSLDELVAAALLLYPRYLDPVTGLPCPPEILVRRLAEGTTPKEGALVRLRRLQGYLNRGIATLSGRAK